MDKVKTEEKSLAVKPTQNALATKVTEGMCMDFLLSSDIGKKLDPQQKKMFLMVSQQQQLNPFSKDIFAIPYKKKGIKTPKGPGDYDMTLITSYHVYMRRVDACGEMDYHFTEFKGTPLKLVEETKKGSYGDYKVKKYVEDPKNPFICVCTVKKYNSSKEVSIEVRFSEFAKDNSQWHEKPWTMLEKCAVAKAMRRFFPKAVSELPYTEEEMTSDMFSNAIDVTPIKKTEQNEPKDKKKKVKTPISDNKDEWEKISSGMKSIGVDDLDKMKLFVKDVTGKRARKYLTDEDYVLLKKAIETIIKEGVIETDAEVIETKNEKEVNQNG